MDNIITKVASVIIINIKNNDDDHPSGQPAKVSRRRRPWCGCITGKDDPPEVIR